MFKYRFPQSDMPGVISHIEAFGIQIISMVPDEDDFIMTTDAAIETTQLSHLTEAYNLSEVV